MQAATASELSGFDSVFLSLIFQIQMIITKETITSETMSVIMETGFLAWKYFFSP